MSDKNISHEEINLLLPWYLNGTLESEEKEIVKKHLSDCSLCHMEIEELKMLRSTVLEANEAQNEMLSVPVEKMEMNVMDRIDSFEESIEQKTQRVPIDDTDSIWSKVQGFFDGIALPSLSPVGMAALFVIQFAIILGLAGTLFFTEPEYEVLSGNTQTEVISGPTIMLSFKDSATEKEIREILREIDGRIIDGPKAGGLYIVELPEEMTNEKIMENVIDDLSSNTKVIKNVFKGSK
ncbi:MAG: hypothetical protein DHS20C13_11040 [Thermodesulfobacteriota bacterium]|nr:MAG: hypothetical protein DHS20C13_11040 [Thermodesulfobacteriota bacterium]